MTEVEAQVPADRFSTIDNIKLLSGLTNSILLFVIIVAGKCVWGLMIKRINNLIPCFQYWQDWNILIYKDFFFEALKRSTKLGLFIGYCYPEERYLSMFLLENILHAFKCRLHDKHVHNISWYCITVLDITVFFIKRAENKIIKSMSI